MALVGIQLLEDAEMLGLMTDKSLPDIIGVAFSFLTLKVSFFVPFLICYFF